MMNDEEASFERHQADDGATRDVEGLFAGRGLMTEAELCIKLGIARRHAYDLRRLEKIGYYEDGRKITYGPSHVAEYLRSREVRKR